MTYQVEGRDHDRAGRARAAATGDGAGGSCDDVGVVGTRINDVDVGDDTAGDGCVGGSGEAAGRRSAQGDGGRRCVAGAGSQECNGADGIKLRSRLGGYAGGRHAAGWKAACQGDRGWRCIIGAGRRGQYRGDGLGSTHDVVRCFVASDVMIRRPVVMERIADGIGAVVGQLRHDDLVLASGKHLRQDRFQRLQAGAVSCRCFYCGQRANVGSAAGETGLCIRMVIKT